MTRDEFDQLPSYNQVPCPDCGLTATEPNPGCHCGRPHINKYHHSCKDAVRSNVEKALNLARKFDVKSSLENALEKEMEIIEETKDHWHRRFLEVSAQFDVMVKVASIETLVILALLIALVFSLTIR